MKIGVYGIKFNPEKLSTFQNLFTYLKTKLNENIISIYSPNKAFPIFPGIKNGKILRLCFNDIIRPYKNLRVIPAINVEILQFIKKKIKLSV